MSVLVKGWSIPTNGCCGCNFRTGKYCGILDKNERVLEHAERYTRPSNCPLVDVPTPHGRLIEEPKELEYSGLAYIYHSDFQGIAEYFAKQIRTLPTVIEAEE